MTKIRSDLFYRLLHEIEYEIGSECYNGNIQNFGPGGVWEGEGRGFRYPVRFINSDGVMAKYKGMLPYAKTSTGKMGYCILGYKYYNSVHYAFGANELYVLRGIKNALEKLEARFNIDFDDLLDIEEKN